MTRKEGHTLIEREAWRESLPERPYISPELLFSPPDGLTDCHVVSLFLLVSWQWWMCPTAEEDEDGWVVFPTVGKDATRHRMGGGVLTVIRSHCKILEKSGLLSVVTKIDGIPLLFRVDYSKLGKAVLAGFPPWKKDQDKQALEQLEGFEGYPTLKGTR